MKTTRLATICITTVAVLGCGNDDVANPSFAENRVPECKGYGGLLNHQALDDRLQRCVDKRAECNRYDVHMLTEYCRIDDSKPLRGQLATLGAKYADDWRATRPKDVPMDECHKS